MNTPTHLLIGAAVLARPAEDAAARRRNAAILIGALVCDAAIFILFAWARLLQGISEHRLWSEVYWQEPWQTLVAIGNSIPLYLGLLIFGLVARSQIAIVFAAAALLHLAFDLPFHHDDAHPHFWPFSDWRFHAPLSYWDRDHHGQLVSLAEIGLAVVLIVFLWRRFASRLVRAVLLLAFATYVAVPAYFTLMLG
ncbi:hypothetical protein [Pelagibius sp.]|uniref:hypothetical protein n=1 Tax=Pelagibius sp. TaxID=1931238 RepID=UPI00262B557D|nr:hypothetical protein [Pelagibius sp.]